MCPKVLKLSSNVRDVFPKVIKLSFAVSECKPLAPGPSPGGAVGGGFRGSLHHSHVDAGSSLDSQAGAYTRPLFGST